MSSSRKNRQDMECDSGSTVRQSLNEARPDSAENRVDPVFTSILGDLPEGLCPLARSYQIGARCSSVGFDWNSPEGAKNKVLEELRELDDAAASGDKSAVFHEAGDVILAAANLARLHGANPEEALQKALERFLMRFNQVERELHRTGRKASDTTLEKLEELWQEAKKQERSF